MQVRFIPYQIEKNISLIPDSASEVMGNMVPHTFASEQFILHKQDEVEN